MHAASRAVSALLAAGLAVTPARAGGLLEFIAVTIDNATSRDLACEALAARWYSFPLGVRRPGGRFAIGLWRDPASGTVSMFNAAQVAVPIGTLYCGFAGEAWETRFELKLQAMLQGARPPRHVALVCGTQDFRLACW